ncbi:MAG: tRNA (adenosine(37)-N6)-threonylcarbamoyltransferase complex dimerization subunit type 1 TsaB [bacterium]|nr:tRNA (adenosine(37)-N6)-threonylcarbamoyltransferase complex dimerization subunit type 1 TsaB [bacterium]
MKILYIDTTSPYLYCAISNNKEITGEIQERLDKDLSVFTLPKIKDLLDKKQYQPNDIDKIIVVNGPGSFTGIRIGVTIAKTYAYSFQKEITTINSLQAMALSSKSQSIYKVPMIDARRGYVFTGIYDSENNSILKEQYIKLETLKCILDNLPGNFSVITNDNIEIENKEEYVPNFEKIINHYQDKEPQNAHLVNPVYLKLTEAEEKQAIETI